MCNCNIITKFASSIIVDISSFIIEFKFVKKVRTVYELLKERDCMGILKHPDIITATTAIIDRSPHTPTLILVYLSGEGGLHLNC